MYAEIDAANKNPVQCPAALPSGDSGSRDDHRCQEPDEYNGDCEQAGLTCNSSATTMVPDMAISVIPVNKAIIAYSPKVLLFQQVTIGSGFGGFELSGVPMRRATRVCGGFFLRCQ